MERQQRGFLGQQPSDQVVAFAVTLIGKLQNKMEHTLKVSREGGRKRHLQTDLKTTQAYVKDNENRTPVPDVVAHSKTGEGLESIKARRSAWRICSSAVRH